MLTARSPSRYRGAVTAFQPGGRAPAPAPLDLVQDFVNTEIPEWAQDDIASPAALARRGCGGEACSSAGAACRRASAFVRARALRVVPARARAREHDRARRLRRGRVAVPIDATLGAPPVRGSRSDDGGEPRLVPAGDGVDRGARDDRRRSRSDAERDGTWARFKACRKEQLRLGLLRPLPQPLLELVLDDDLRQPDEDGRLPPPDGRRGEGGGLRRSRSPGGGCGAARRARCSRRPGSPSARPCSSACSPARRSRRIAASLRRSSGSRPPRARCGPCGSASPVGADQA